MAVGSQLFDDDILGIVVAPGCVLLFGHVGSILNEEGS
jgi:hypothetical protein